MAVNFCRVVLASVDLLILQLCCKTIASIGTRRKKVVEQAVFLLKNFFHLSSTSINSYLVSIAVAVAIIALHLAFCLFCQFCSTIIGSKVIIRSRVGGRQKDLWKKKTRCL